MTLARIIDRWVDAYFRFHPEQATEKGWHAYDSLAPSFSPEAVGGLRAAIAQARADLSGAGASTAGSAEALDRTLLEAHLELATFRIDALGWLSTNPLSYVEPALDALHNLELAHYLPQARRRAALRQRLRGIPVVLEEARRQLHAPMAPYRDAALLMLEGALEDLGQRYAAREVGRSVAGAADVARKGIDRHLSWMERRSRDVRPFAPMGEERYAHLLAQAHFLEGGVEPLLRLARRTLAEMDAAIQEAPAAPPPEAVPDDFGWKEVLAYYRSELEAVRRFVSQRGLITLPRAELILHETPEYLRHLAPSLFYQAPPAFSRSRRGHLFVQRVPRRMTSEQRRDHHARVAGRRFRNAVAHEVWPGHHVQLVRAAEHRSALRKYRDDDVMVEGWALYAEALMREAGLWGEAERERIRPLQALRFRAARVVVDVGLHTGRLSPGEAVEWMIETLGVSNRAWMEREVRRYLAEPGQAMSYLVGREAILSLREAWREAMGARFTLRGFHDRFLAEGSIPVPLIRRRMLEGAARRSPRPFAAEVPSSIVTR